MATAATGDSILQLQQSSKATAVQSNVLAFSSKLAYSAISLSLSSSPDEHIKIFNPSGGTLHALPTTSNRTWPNYKTGLSMVTTHQPHLL